jgi:hypothetical protein
MNKTVINYIVDILLFLALIPLAGIGIIIEYVLPPESKKLPFLALTRHEWGAIHWYCAIAFAILLVIHLILHWNWFVCTTKSLFKKKKKVHR